MSNMFTKPGSGYAASQYAMSEDLANQSMALNQEMWDFAKDYWANYGQPQANQYMSMLSKQIPQIQGIQNLTNNWQGLDWQGLGREYEKSLVTPWEWNINKAATGLQEGLDSNLTRRGLDFGGTMGGSMSNAVQNARERNLALAKAQATQNRLGYEQGLRAEDSQNYWNFMNYLTQQQGMLSGQGSPNALIGAGQNAANAMGNMSGQMGSMGAANMQNAASAGSGLWNGLFGLIGAAPWKK